MFLKIKREDGKRIETVNLNNNTSKYVPADFCKMEKTVHMNQNIEEVTAKIIKNHIKAFEELAK